MSGTVDNAKAEILAKACATVIAKKFRDAGYRPAVVVVAVSEIERVIVKGVWTELDGVKTS